MEPPDAANASATSDTVFDELPPETVSIIFRFLSPEDLNSLRTVCRRFRDILSDEVLWKAIYTYQWDYVRSVQQRTKSFRELVLRNLQAEQALQRLSTSLITAPEPPAAAAGFPLSPEPDGSDQGSDDEVLSDEEGVEDDELADDDSEGMDELPADLRISAQSPTDHDYLCVSTPKSLLSAFTTQTVVAMLASAVRVHAESRTRQRLVSFGLVPACVLVYRKSVDVSDKLRALHILAEACFNDMPITRLIAQSRLHEDLMRHNTLFAMRSSIGPTAAIYSMLAMAHNHVNCKGVFTQPSPCPERLSGHSGQWRGWYVYNTVQFDEEMMVHFTVTDEGQLKGAGSDKQGAFQLTGVLGPMLVALCKSYHHGHFEWVYRGSTFSWGLAGAWGNPNWGGPWFLWRDAQAPEEHARRHDELLAQAANVPLWVIGGDGTPECQAQ